MCIDFLLISCYSFLVDFILMFGLDIIRKLTILRLEMVSQVFEKLISYFFCPLILQPVPCRYNELDSSLLTMQVISTANKFSAGMPPA